MARAWSLVSRPEGLPTPDNFRLLDLGRPELAEGEVRIANEWLSVDPYMRGRMNDVKSYTPPFGLGEAMTGGAIGRVTESRSDQFKPGEIVQHFAGWRDEAVLPADQVKPLPQLEVEPQAYLGQLGVPGMTAYFGLLDIAAAQEGETVFVSAAAGAVGSTVVQIAKAKGMHVIASAGGPEKCAWVQSLGADSVIDYKAGTPIVQALGEQARNGIDVYFDNVGGDHLDAAFAHAKLHARFAVCGMIDGYNAADPVQLRYIARMIGMRVRLQGFIVTDFADRAAEFYRDMGGWLKDGKLTREETVVDGLERMPEAFLGLFSGQNKGKMLVRV
jgi:NADPH-dependent curcumin reductase CurA